MVARFARIYCVPSQQSFALIMRRILSRSCRPLVLAGLCMACYAHRSLPISAVAPPASVEITFWSPRPVMVMSENNRVDSVPDVRQVRGRVLAVRGDTLWLRATELKASSRPASQIADASGATNAGVTTRVIRDSTVVVTERRLSKGRTAGLLCSCSCLSATWQPRSSGIRHRELQLVD